METRRRWSNMIEDVLVQSTWDRTQIFAAHCTAVPADCKFSKTGSSPNRRTDTLSRTSGHSSSKIKNIKTTFGIIFLSY